MPPKVEQPAASQTITVQLYPFQWRNAHGLHPAVQNITNWKLLVGTTQNGNNVYDSGWLPVGTTSSNVNKPAGLGANATCYTQVNYMKTDGSTWCSTTNQFTWA